MLRHIPAAADKTDKGKTDKAKTDGRNNYPDGQTSSARQPA